MDQNILPALKALRFYLVAHKLRIAVFGLTSNVSENRQIDFFTLNIFTVTYGSEYIGLLSVDTSGVDTMAASKISLY